MKKYVMMYTRKFPDHRISFDDKIHHELNDSPF